MDGAGHSGKWSKKAPFGTILIIMCVFLPTSMLLQPSEEPKCKTDEYLENGICCNKCAQGFKLVRECQKEGERSNCSECPKGQFMANPNWHHNCFSCKSCKKNHHKIVVSECKPEQDTVCQCEEGYYEKFHAPESFDCLKCKKCGPDEKENQTCTSEKNTVCECKENYYRVNQKCVPCTTCTHECKEHCLPLVKPDADEFLKNVIAGVATVAIVLLVVVVLVSVSLITIKSRTKRRSQDQSSKPSDDSMDSLQVLIHDEPSEKSLKAVPLNPVTEEEPSNLPDCVPLEIKFPDLFYTVLDLVPVSQVKQLVRILGVTDIEIGRAEMDHRGSCHEAQYQMLKVWAQRGSQAGRGQDGMLHLPLLQELIDKLRMMHLGQAAEELETKYGIQ